MTKQLSEVYAEHADDLAAAIASGQATVGDLAPLRQLVELSATAEESDPSTITAHLDDLYRRITNGVADVNDVEPIRKATAKLTADAPDLPVVPSDALDPTDVAPPAPEPVEAQPLTPEQEIDAARQRAAAERAAAGLPPEPVTTAGSTRAEPGFSSSEAAAAADAGVPPLTEPGAVAGNPNAPGPPFPKPTE